MSVTDSKKIKKILELKANYQKLEKCTVCGNQTEDCHYHSKGSDKIGYILCKECNNLKIAKEDVKGDYLLEHLYKRVYGT